MATEAVIQEPASVTKTEGADEYLASKQIDSIVEYGGREGHPEIVGQSIEPQRVIQVEDENNTPNKSDSAKSKSESFSELADTAKLTNGEQMKSDDTEQMQNDQKPQQMDDSGDKENEVTGRTKQEAGENVSAEEENVQIVEKEPSESEMHLKEAELIYENVEATSAHTLEKPEKVEDINQVSHSADQENCAEETQSTETVEKGKEEKLLSHTAAKNSIPSTEERQESETQEKARTEEVQGVNEVVNEEKDIIKKNEKDFHTEKQIIEEHNKTDVSPVHVKQEKLKSSEGAKDYPPVSISGEMVKIPEISEQDETSKQASEELGTSSTRKDREELVKDTSNIPGETIGQSPEEETAVRNVPNQQKSEGVDEYLATEQVDPTVENGHEGPPGISRQSIEPQSMEDAADENNALNKRISETSQGESFSESEDTAEPANAEQMKLDETKERNNEQKPQHVEDVGDKENEIMEKTKQEPRQHVPVEENIQIVEKETGEPEMRLKEAEIINEKVETTSTDTPENPVEDVEQLSNSADQENFTEETQPIETVESEKNGLLNDKTAKKLIPSEAESQESENQVDARTEVHGEIKHGNAEKDIIDKNEEIFEGFKVTDEEDNNEKQILEEHNNTDASPEEERFNIPERGMSNLLASIKEETVKIPEKGQQDDTSKQASEELETRSIDKDSELVKDPSDMPVERAEQSPEKETAVSNVPNQRKSEKTAIPEETIDDKSEHTGDSQVSEEKTVEIIQDNIVNYSLVSEVSEGETKEVAPPKEETTLNDSVYVGTATAKEGNILKDEGSSGLVLKEEVLETTETEGTKTEAEFVKLKTDETFNFDLNQEESTEVLEDSQEKEEREALDLLDAVTENPKDVTASKSLSKDQRLQLAETEGKIAEKSQVTCEEKTKVEAETKLEVQEEIEKEQEENVTIKTVILYDQVHEEGGNAVDTDHIKEQVTQKKTDLDEANNEVRGSSEATAQTPESQEFTETGSVEIKNPTQEREASLSKNFEEKVQDEGSERAFLQIRPAEQSEEKLKEIGEVLKDEKPGAEGSASEVINPTTKDVAGEEADGIKQSLTEGFMGAVSSNDHEHDKEETIRVEIPDADKTEEKKSHTDGSNELKDQQTGENPIAETPVPLEAVSLDENTHNQTLPAAESGKHVENPSCELPSKESPLKSTGSIVKIEETPKVAETVKYEIQEGPSAARPTEEKWSQQELHEEVEESPQEEKSNGDQTLTLEEPCLLKAPEEEIPAETERAYSTEIKKTDDEQTKAAEFREDRSQEGSKNPNTTKITEAYADHNILVETSEPDQALTSAMASDTRDQKTPKYVEQINHDERNEAEMAENETQESVKALEVTEILTVEILSNEASDKQAPYTALVSEEEKQAAPSDAMAIQEGKTEDKETADDEREDGPDAVKTAEKICLEDEQPRDVEAPEKDKVIADQILLEEQSEILSSELPSDKSEIRNTTTVEKSEQKSRLTEEKKSQIEASDEQLQIPAATLSSEEQEHAITSETQERVPKDSELAREEPHEGSDTTKTTEIIADQNPPKEARAEQIQTPSSALSMEKQVQETPTEAKKTHEEETKEGEVVEDETQKGPKDSKTAENIYKEEPRKLEASEKGQNTADQTTPLEQLQILSSELSEHENAEKTYEGSKAADKDGYKEKQIIEELNNPDASPVHMEEERLKISKGALDNPPLSIKEEMVKIPEKSAQDETSKQVSEELDTSSIDRDRDELVKDPSIMPGETIAQIPEEESAVSNVPNHQKIEDANEAREDLDTTETAEIPTDQKLQEEKRDEQILSQSSVLSSDKQVLKTPTEMGKIQDETKKAEVTESEPHDRTYEGPDTVKTAELPADPNLQEEKPDEKIRTQSSLLFAQKQVQEALSKIHDETTEAEVAEFVTQDCPNSPKTSENICLQQEKPRELKVSEEDEDAKDPSPMAEKSQELLALSSTLPSHEQQEEQESLPTNESKEDFSAGAAMKNLRLEKQEQGMDGPAEVNEKRKALDIASEPEAKETEKDIDHAVSTENPIITEEEAQKEKTHCPEGESNEKFIEPLIKSEDPETQEQHHAVALADSKAKENQDTKTTDEDDAEKTKEDTCLPHEQSQELESSQEEKSSTDQNLPTEELCLPKEQIKEKQILEEQTTDHKACNEEFAADQSLTEEAIDKRTHIASSVLPSGEQGSLILSELQESETKEFEVIVDETHEGSSPENITEVQAHQNLPVETTDEQIQTRSSVLSSEKQAEETSAEVRKAQEDETKEAEGAEAETQEFANIAKTAENMRLQEEEPGDVQEASKKDEDTSDQSLFADKLPEQLQVLSSALPSQEQKREPYDLRAGEEDEIADFKHETNDEERREDESPENSFASKQTEEACSQKEETGDATEHRTGLSLNPPAVDIGQEPEKKQHEGTDMAKDITQDPTNASDNDKKIQPAETTEANEIIENEAANEELGKKKGVQETSDQITIPEETMIESCKEDKLTGTSGIITREAPEKELSEGNEEMIAENKVQEPILLPDPMLGTTDQVSAERETTKARQDDEKNANEVADEVNPQDLKMEEISAYNATNDTGEKKEPGMEKPQNEGFACRQQDCEIPQQLEKTVPAALGKQEIEVSKKNEGEDQEPRNVESPLSEAKEREHSLDKPMDGPEKQTATLPTMEISPRNSLPCLLEKAKKDTSQVEKYEKEKKETVAKEEGTDIEEAKTGEFEGPEATHVEEAKIREEKDEEDAGYEYKEEKTGPEDITIGEAKDPNNKAPHKKSHNILSGVGSKVKHSISKVKKAITGKSSHPKPLSPK